ncbi:hypothetical protein QN277_009423 [Acacia crassicarpa]|uniref:Uncharacterized protein n=1 Tax=Acacia crassicarpa TaxID=499986 RepID=A0AAE1JM39_9FABA|nr:hypothetical protein QN277_009423 [Acacia crassicarpa]
MADQGTTNSIDILLAIIPPLLGVFLKIGYHLEFWICLVLTFLAIYLELSLRLCHHQVKTTSLFSS